MIDEEKLTHLLEGFDLPLEKIDEIVLEFKKIDKDPDPYIKEAEADGLHIDYLKTQLLSETDWRKRAVIAAQIISRGLE